MKLLTWLGVAIAVCGTVLMSLSERLPGFSTDRVPGWFDQVHWYLLVGISPRPTASPHQADDGSGCAGWLRERVRISCVKEAARVKSSAWVAKVAMNCVSATFERCYFSTLG
jgi:hypothetical protein